MKIIVVIPTYNEAENIGRLIPLLAKEFKKIPSHDAHVLVVDGNSPDGTSQVVRDLRNEYPFVHLLVETKKAGLGAAYIQGFRHAMHELNADVIVEMDADFQHDPADLPALIREIDNGYDYVIGSRFTKGGSIPGNWAFHRKLQSWGGNLLSKIVLGMFNVNDFTSGFKASRVKGFVDRLDLDSVLSKGFAYKIDLLYKMYKAGSRIKEVPILFGMRDRGDSKMESNNLIDSLRVLILLRVYQNKNFFRFIIVGFAGLGVDVTLSNIFRILLPAANVAASLAALFAMVVTFTLNNFWSFKERKILDHKKQVLSFLTYIGFSSIPIVFRYYFVGFIVERYGNFFLPYNGALFVSILFGLVWNFTVYSKIIWRTTGKPKELK